MFLMSNRSCESLKSSSIDVRHDLIFDSWSWVKGGPSEIDVSVIERCVVVGLEYSRRTDLLLASLPIPSRDEEGVKRSTFRDDSGGCSSFSLLPAPRGRDCTRTEVWELSIGRPLLSGTPTEDPLPMVAQMDSFKQLHSAACEKKWAGLAQHMCRVGKDRRETVVHVHVMV